MKRAESEAYARMTQRKPAAKKQSDTNHQMNLF